MNLDEITLLGQPYTLYVTVFMIMLIVIKSEEIPRKVSVAIGIILFILMLIFIIYTLRKTLM